MPEHKAFQNNVFRIKFHMHNEFFLRTLSAFNDEDSNFRPQQNMLSVKDQVMHTVGAIELFVSAYLATLESTSKITHTSFRPGQVWLGSSTAVTDMRWTQNADKKQFDEEVNMEEIKAIFSKTMAYASDAFAIPSEVELQQPIGENSLVPDFFCAEDIIEIMLDHTAHHRGALAQYARLLGHSPKIPYFDM
ncbi:DinB family protein [Pseudoalteromonas sp. SS15]|uniref:DinB family protein n=1 Tax=Pseudoalteromonas sp. SS15 TaxID=3139393 RepID=UPI003BA8C100